MNFSTTQTIEIETAPDPRYSVIWLHGLGASADDFVPVVNELKKSGVHAIRFIFPNAPSIPVTVNGGYVMPAWYDILSMSGLSRQVDHQGIVDSIAIVDTLITQEVARGVPSEHIFIAGFSQGGAIAYTAALTHGKRLAGVIALSTYIPEPEWLKAQFNAIQTNLPIFTAHGTHDPVVPFALGQQAATLATALGASVNWHHYPMQHQVCLEQIQDIDTWLSNHITLASNAAD